VLEHNAKPNEKTLDIPDQVWRAHVSGLLSHQDDPDPALIAFLPVVPMIMERLPTMPWNMHPRCPGIRTRP
jgi:hypothetical protein